MEMGQGVGSVELRLSRSRKEAESQGERGAFWEVRWHSSQHASVEFKELLRANPAGSRHMDLDQEPSPGAQLFSLKMGLMTPACPS